MESAEARSIGSENTILIALVPKPITSLIDGVVTSIGVNATSCLIVLVRSELLTPSTVIFVSFWLSSLLPSDKFSLSRVKRTLFLSAERAADLISLLIL
ncbi:hypothetical protein D3C81_1088090 [compost metagenome]